MATYADGRPATGRAVVLAIAVATLWLLRVGGKAEVDAQAKQATVNIWQHEQMCRKCWGKAVCLREATEEF